MSLRADAVLFDKDGTLFEFGATWDAWGRAALEHFSEGDTEALRALAEDPGLQRRMGQAARAELEAHWHGSDGAHIISPEILEWVEG